MHIKMMYSITLFKNIFQYHSKDQQWKTTITFVPTQQLPARDPELPVLVGGLPGSYS